jgi:hypothetical protein
VAVVTVEEVKGRAAFKRFVELPYLLFRDEPRWSPPLASYERARLDPHNRFFDAGDGEYFLARRGGVVAGRITAHVAGRGDTDGWFGFYDAIDDAAVVRALVERAREWLREHGCTTMAGPASFTTADDLGILVDGFEAAGTTGRQWHPPWYHEHLAAADLQPTAEQRTWRVVSEAGPHPPSVEGPRPALAGRFADPRIVLPGITAVPDLTPARGSAMALARMGRRRAWTTCTVVTVDGDPEVLVPQLRGAAADAGYEWVISPWSPDTNAASETVHARFRTET